MSQLAYAMRRYFLFDSWDSAAEFRQAIDATLGLPSGGVGGDGWSITWDLLLAHPSRSIWAYHNGAKLQSRMAGHALLNRESLPLNPGWTGARRVMPSFYGVPEHVKQRFEPHYLQTIATTECAFLMEHGQLSELPQACALVERNLIEYFAERPDELKRIDRRLFEELTADVFRRFRYDVELTKATRDGGYDVLAVVPSDRSLRYLVECKRPDLGNKIGVRPVRELVGVRNIEKATAAILVTTAEFTPDARAISGRCNWDLELRDFDGLMDWLKRTAR